MYSYIAGMPPRPPKSNAVLAASLVALIGACAALPYFLSRAPSESRRVIHPIAYNVSRHLQPLLSTSRKGQANSYGAAQIDTSKPLAPSTGVRGPYVNTGSRDIGPDLPAKGR